MLIVLLLLAAAAAVYYYVRARRLKAEASGHRWQVRDWVGFGG